MDGVTPAKNKQESGDEQATRVGHDPSSRDRCFCPANGGITLKRQKGGKMDSEMKKR